MIFFMKLIQNTSYEFNMGGFIRNSCEDLIRNSYEHFARNSYEFIVKSSYEIHMVFV